MNLGRYPGPGEAYPDAYGSSPHSHHGHYDSSPPFQTVPGSGVPTPEHWSPNGGGSNGVVSSSGGSGGGSNSGGNTPVDMQHMGNPHHLPHPAYLPSHLSHNSRDQGQNGGGGGQQQQQQQMSHHSHHHHHNPHHGHLTSNGDIKPVIPTAMLGGYSGVYAYRI
jgi:hypothetical protein